MARSYRVDAENGFLIDGKVYPVPTLDSLTLDESELLYDRCGVVLEDFGWMDDESDDEREEWVGKLTRNPGFMGALVQIAYQRGNPNMRAKQVEVVVRNANRVDVFSTLGGPVEEPDTPPLASTSEPGAPSLSGSLVSDNSTGNSSESSGSGSPNGSDGQDGEVVPIGTTRLDTSSTSAPQTLAASGQQT